jgi:hypothetical protein
MHGALVTSHNDLNPCSKMGQVYYCCACASARYTGLPPQTTTRNPNLPQQEFRQPLKRTLLTLWRKFGKQSLHKVQFCRLFSSESLHWRNCVPSIGRSCPPPFQPSQLPIRNHRQVASACGHAVPTFFLCYPVFSVSCPLLCLHSVYFSALTVEWSRYSDGLRAGRPGFDSRQCKNLLSHTASRLTLGPTQPPIPWVRGFSPG